MIETATDLRKLADVRCDGCLGNGYIAFSYPRPGGNPSYQERPHEDCRGTGKRFPLLWRECGGVCKHPFAWTGICGEEHCTEHDRVYRFHGSKGGHSCECGDNGTGYVLITDNVFDALAEVAADYKLSATKLGPLWEIELKSYAPGAPVVGEGKTFREALLAALVQAMAS